MWLFLGTFQLPSSSPRPSFDPLVPSADVKSVISKVSPQVVFLELCPERKNLIAERKASTEEATQQVRITSTTASSPKKVPNERVHGS